jgi:hypothetical protein
MGRTCQADGINPYTCSGGNYVSGNYVAGNYVAGTPYSCNCSTCYPQYLRVLQSASSVVSTITSWTLAAVARSLRVKTSGSQITAQVFSDTNLATQIGSDLVYTPNGAAITGNSGIIVYPSSTSQGTTLGTTKITIN